MASTWRSSVPYLRNDEGYIAQNYTTLFKLAISLSDYMDPFHSGFLSMLLRNAPFNDEQDGLDQLEASIQKELTAALSSYHPAILDYTSIFESGSSNRYVRVYHNLPIVEDVAREIHGAFIRARKKLLTATVFYPKYSHKLVGRVARDNARQCKGMWGGDKIKSTLDLERFYMKTGWRIEGPVEIGMAWKYNELKPRVFYKRGPTVYNASRYIQQIYNLIIDQIVSVNRQSRFHTSTVQFTASDITFIYDYAAFTSSLLEIRNFTSSMAKFFKGYNIRVLDSRLGIITIDLGDYLDDYNAFCNTDAEFECSNVLGSMVDILLQHNCGMLGVPGNITGCTLLHGIHLAFIVGAVARGKAVGDDAFGVKELSGDGIKAEIGVLLDQVRNIGVVAEEKTEIWRAQDAEKDTEIWNYLKRPISRIGDTRMDFGDLVDWPGVAGILNLSDNLHTTPLDNLPYDRLKRFVGQCTSLLRSLEFKGLVLQEYSSFFNRFLRKSYQVMGIDLDSYTAPYAPDLILPQPKWRGDFVREMLEQNSRKIIKVPEFWVPGSTDPDFRAGSVFIYTSCPPLKFLTDMGYLVMQKRTRWMVVDDEPEVFTMLMCRSSTRYKIAYDVCVVEDIPEYAYELLDEAHVPHERSVPYDMDVYEDFGIRDLLE
jgi:hypothetical protein